MAAFAQLPPNCSRFTTVKGGESCDDICSERGVSTYAPLTAMARRRWGLHPDTFGFRFQLTFVNPNINRECSNLVTGEVSIISPRKNLTDHTPGVVRAATMLGQVRSGLRQCYTGAEPRLLHGYRCCTWH